MPQKKLATSRLSGKSDDPFSRGPAMPAPRPVNPKYSGPLGEQLQMFDPGPRRDRWANHPDDWQARGDVAWHASSSPDLPRKDRGASVEKSWGSTHGMHFGSKAAAMARFTDVDNFNSKKGYQIGESDERSPRNVHGVRMSGEQFRPTDALVGAQNDKWGDDAVNGLLTGDVQPKGDSNYLNPTPLNEMVDDAVDAGKVLPYRNEVEDVGSTSYRAKPEATRTWQEDVRNDPNSHPALSHLADKGYTVGMDARKIREQYLTKEYSDYLNPTLFDTSKDMTDRKYNRNKGYDATEVYNKAPSGLIKFR